MSRSRKKAIFKEGTGAWRKVCRRTVKRSQKQFLRNNLDEIANGDAVIPDGKEIVNDYTYCDYVSDCEHSTKSPWLSEERLKELKEKLSRK